MPPIPENSLLYAHTAMCHYARGHRQLDRFCAVILCDAINDFQNALRHRLKPDACGMHIVELANGYHAVEPYGGW